MINWKEETAITSQLMNMRRNRIVKQESSFLVGKE